MLIQPRDRFLWPLLPPPPPLDNECVDDGYSFFLPPSLSLGSNYAGAVASLKFLKRSADKLGQCGFSLGWMSGAVHADTFFFLFFTSLA